MPVVRFSTTSRDTVNIIKNIHRYSKSLFNVSIGFAFGIMSICALYPNPFLYQSLNNYDKMDEDECKECLECLDCGCLKENITNEIMHKCKNKMDPEIVFVPIDLSIHNN